MLYTEVQKNQFMSQQISHLDQQVYSVYLF
jgi:hypothetical protein